MFITIKLSRKVLVCAASGLAALVLLLLCVCFVPKLTAPAMAPDSDAQLCIDALSGFGWQVEAAPLETEDVLLPDGLSEGYLALQTEAGFQLTKYIGQTVTRYTFQVLNYPTGEAGVLADVLVWNGQVIGGDIRTADLEGFIHSLRYPA